MNRAELAGALAPYSPRIIRSFLKSGDPEALDAFWALIYYDHSEVDYETARAVDAALEVSSRRVRDVINGWRPAVLGGALT